MKYWAYLAAKLAVSGLFLYGLWMAIVLALSPRSYTLGVRMDPFAHDLGYTTAAMAFYLLCAGVLFLIVQDQRYRCRTCLRRLRSPISSGSWPNSFLLGRPRREYICIYGHGTLKVPQEKITGSGAPDWHPHSDDILKELEESAPKQ